MHSRVTYRVFFFHWYLVTRCSLEEDKLSRWDPVIGFQSIPASCNIL